MNITDIRKHKLLQYHQTEQRCVFSNGHVFCSNKTVVKLTLNRILIILYSTVQIVLVMWIPHDLPCLH